MTTVQNPLFRQCLAEIPAQQRAEYELCQMIADRIDEILKQQHLTQRDLARLTGKSESEISKWMTGRHNFTMKTLSLISTALATPVIRV